MGCHLWASLSLRLATYINNSISGVCVAMRPAVRMQLDPDGSTGLGLELKVRLPHAVASVYLSSNNNMYSIHVHVTTCSSYGIHTSTYC
jgi:hypothetical protein